MPNIYLEKVAEIRVAIKYQFLVAIDETIDSEKKSVANVVCGVLTCDKDLAAKKILIRMEVLEKVDCGAIVILFQELFGTFPRISILTKFYFYCLTLPLT